MKVAVTRDSRRNALRRKSFILIVKRIRTMKSIPSRKSGLIKDKLHAGKLLRETVAHLRLLRLDDEVVVDEFDRVVAGAVVLASRLIISK